MILFSVTQLCAVMSKPSKRMWDSGIRILMWLRDNYKTGIRFYSNGCTEPCIFYDAGHNQYASDSKAHHGNVAVFAGGPVGNDSKKHDDVGDSTPMNEYMALYWAARRGRRQLSFDNRQFGKEEELIKQLLGLAKPAPLRDISAPEGDGLGSLGH